MNPVNSRAERLFHKSKEDTNQLLWYDELMKITDYCADLNIPEAEADIRPWSLLTKLEELIKEQLKTLGDQYKIHNDVAVHQSATVDPTATIKGPAIIGPDCFIGPHSVVRGGVYLKEAVSVGPSCEVKHCLVGKHTAFAHFNFIGDSIVGSGVNLEAGAVIANHYNEREDKRITVFDNGTKIDTGLTKFGAIIGDNTKIGANAVTSPGTLLPKGSIVRRLELVEQV